MLFHPQIQLEIRYVLSSHFLYMKLLNLTKVWEDLALAIMENYGFFSSETTVVYLC